MKPRGRGREPTSRFFINSTVSVRLQFGHETLNSAEKKPAKNNEIKPSDIRCIIPPANLACFSLVPCLSDLPWCLSPSPLIISCRIPTPQFALQDTAMIVAVVEIFLFGIDTDFFV